MKGKNKEIKVHELLDGNQQEVFRKKKATQQSFEAALQHYYQKEFDKSAMLFKQVVRENKDDLAAKRYLEHSADYLVNEVPDDWTGAETMEGK